MFLFFFGLYQEFDLGCPIPLATESSWYSMATSSSCRMAAAWLWIRMHAIMEGNMFVCHWCNDPAACVIIHFRIACTHIHT